MRLNKVPGELRLVVTATLIAVAVVIAGCGGGGGGGGDATLPTVTDLSYTRPISPRAGTVSFSAVLADAGGISRGEVVLTIPSGAVITLPMTVTSGVYSASYDYPANSGSAAQVYSFVVRAVDCAGNTATAGPYTFEVPAADSPPPPPFSP
jgi:hypothetical protein